MEAIFQDFMVKEALILVPALYILGAIIKRTPAVPDWCIPYILLVSGIGGSIALMGVTASAVIQGILVTGAAVLSNQIVKQTTEAVSISQTISSMSGTEDEGKGQE